MADKPVVDGIEQRHRAELAVIRLNIQDASVKPLLERYHFQFTPTFIFFDSQGRELWRTIGSVSPSRVEQSLKAA